MGVRIKVAKTPKELDDVFWLRHEVYVNEEGYFSSLQPGSQAIIDRFDALPPVANIVAYAGDDPVGTLRINLDSGQGLPPEEVYDFGEYRRQVTEEWRKTHGEEPRIGSAGMLAIRKPWRHRPDVIRAMFKLAAGIGGAWHGTHIIAPVNAKTASMYKRIGFTGLGEQTWVETIGEYIVPMACTFELFYRWAFGDLLDNNGMLLGFSSRFQRLVLATDEVIFREGDEAREAYVVDSGAVRISRQVGAQGEELTFATLGRGGLFGELSLIDTKPRSAQATAAAKTELIALDRDDFLNELKTHPMRMHELLEIFAARLRRADELAVLLARGSAAQRMEYALSDLQLSAAQDPKRVGVLISKAGPAELARNAGVSEEEARRYLEACKKEKRIEFSTRSIRFLVPE